MGMMSQGRARSRWVGILVVVLALTASRTNFPLLNGARFILLKGAAAPSFQKHQSAHKSEGVIPSRRALESRRLAQAQSNQEEARPRTSGDIFAWDNGGAGVHPSPKSDRIQCVTRPEYLQLHLRASSVSTLPPPA